MKGRVSLTQLKDNAMKLRTWHTALVLRLENAPVEDVDRILAKIVEIENEIEKIDNYLNSVFEKYMKYKSVNNLPC